MSTEALNRLEEAVLSLPRAERAQLVERIIASLDQDSEVEEAWAAEIRSRIEAMDRGDIELVPAREVIEEAKRILQS